MPLTKKAKIWIIVLAIPVILIVGGAIALKLYFTSERLKSMIIPRAEEATGLRVQMEDISFTVFPTLGVDIDGLRVWVADSTRFLKQDVATVSNIRVAVKLLPLLSSRVEIDNVYVDNPRIYLEVSPNGRKNYSASRAADVAGQEAQGGGGANIILANMEIQNGELEYVDRQYDSHMMLSGLQQTADASTSGGTSLLQLNARGSVQSFSYGTLQTLYVQNLSITDEGRLSFDMATNTITIDTASLKVNSIPMSLKGTIGIQPKGMMLDLSMVSPEVSMSQVLSLIPPEQLKAAEGLKSSGTATFSMIIRGESSDNLSPDARGEFSLSGGTIQYASLPKSITNIGLAGAFNKPAGPIDAKGIGSFSIDRLSAMVGSNTVSATLNVQNFDDPSIKAVVNGALNLNEVKDFYPLEEGTELSGVMKSAITVEGKSKVPSSIRGNGTIEFQNVSIKTATSPRPLRNLQGTITFNNETIQSKGLSMNIGESDLNLGFTMRNYLSMVMPETTKTKRPSATMTLTSRRIRTVDLVAQTPEKGAEAGAAKTQAAGGGLVPGIDVDANVSIDRLETEEFQFTNAKGTLGLTNGIVNLKNFSVNAFDGTIRTKGMLDTRDEKKRPFNLDLDIQNVQSNTMLSKFTSFGKYMSGKVSMSTTMKGDLNDTLGFDQRTLMGEGSVNLAEGKLENLPLMASVAAFTGLEELKVVAFNQWTNKFSISDGRVNIRDLNVKAGATDLAVNGSHGLDGTLAYTLNVKLPGSVTDRLKLPGVASQLLQFFKDQNGRVNLNFLVSGTNASPSLKLDTKEQEEKAKNAVKQKLEEEAKKKGEDLLKKILKPK